MILGDLNLKKIEENLLKKQRDIQEQLKLLEQQDPVLLQTIDVSEIGSDSWEADVHMKTLAVKNKLLALSEEIDDTIMRLDQGTYGKCKNCGKYISSERLKAMPTASLCESCIIR